MFKKRFNYVIDFEKLSQLGPLKKLVMVSICDFFNFCRKKIVATYKVPGVTCDITSVT